MALGAASVALAYLTISAYLPRISAPRRALLTLGFALGTAQGYMSALGTVWFMGQVAAALFMWGFLLGMLWRRPLLAGFCLAAVMLARPSVIPAAVILYVGWLWLDRRSIGINFRWFLEEKIILPPPAPLHIPQLRFGTQARRGRKTNLEGESPSPRGRGLGRGQTSFFINLILFGLPLLLSLGFMAWYNAARFGNPSDFGYSYIQDADNIAARRLEHGSFSPAFLPSNLYTATLRPPLLENGRLKPDPWGQGVLFSSPFLLYGLLALRRAEPEQKRRYLLLSLAALGMLLPALLYHNSGSAQFGYRFYLDALPVWMILVGVGAEKAKPRLLIGAVLFSVVLHLWGFFWLYEMINGQAWP